MSNNDTQELRAENERLRYAIDTAMRFLQSALDNASAVARGTDGVLHEAAVGAWVNTNKAAKALKQDASDGKAE